MKILYFTYLLLAYIVAATDEKEAPPLHPEYLPKSIKPGRPPRVNPVPSRVLNPTNDFSYERVGARSTTFYPMSGYWLIGMDVDNLILVSDGRNWDEKSGAVDFITQRALAMGKDNAELIAENMKAHTDFQFALVDYLGDFSDGEISVRFKVIAGKQDRSAGILFNLKPNGDHWILRANTLDKNVALYKYTKGHRGVIRWSPKVALQEKRWHTLKLAVMNLELQAYLNDQWLLKHQLVEKVSGRIGAWTKADSVVYFDDYTIKPTLSQLPKGTPEMVLPEGQAPNRK